MAEVEKQAQAIFDTFKADVFPKKVAIGQSYGRAVYQMWLREVWEEKLGTRAPAEAAAVWNPLIDPFVKCGAPDCPA